MTESKTYKVSPSSSGELYRFLVLCRTLATTIMWFLLLMLNLWAVAALYVDCRNASIRIVLVVIYLAVLVLLIARTDGGGPSPVSFVFA